MKSEPPTLVELLTDFAKASGLRQDDLQCIRTNHILDDPFSDEILIVYHRTGQDGYHHIPILLDHEDVVLYLLKEHRNDQDPWFPVIPADVDCEATRRYYVQQLNAQAELFQLPPFSRKKTLAWIADLLEESVYGIVKRYELPPAPRRRCCGWAKIESKRRKAEARDNASPIDDSWPSLTSESHNTLAFVSSSDEEMSLEEQRLSTARALRRRRFGTRRMGMVPTSTTTEDHPDEGEAHE